MSVTAVILAAGEGKRFFPLVTSKPLFPFLSVPILKHTLDALDKSGFKKIVIVTNPQDATEVKNLSQKQSNIKYAIQKSPTGMSDAILSAQVYLKGSSIFILNAQDVVDQHLFDLAFKATNKQKNFIIAKKQKEYFDGGYLRVKNNRLLEIIEKPGENNQPSDFINLVFHFFSHPDEFLNQLKQTKSSSDDVYERAFSSFAKKENVEVIPYEGFWQTVKYSWQILNMTDVMLQHFLKPQNNATFIAKSARVDQNVYLGKGVKVLENVVIKGPSYIGDNTLIGTNTLVINSMIGQQSVIGYGSEVSRSYLGDNCWIHTNYIGDSVLEGGNYFGAGAVTANFRFDAGHIKTHFKGERINTQRNKFGAIIAKDARVGVNASIMPGVKIGGKSTVGPGVVLLQDVPAQTRTFVSQQLQERKG